MAKATQRVYTNPLLNPETAGVYQKSNGLTNTPAAVNAPQVEVNNPLDSINGFSQKYNEYLGSKGLGGNGYGKIDNKEYVDKTFDFEPALGRFRSSELGSTVNNVPAGTTYGGKSGGAYGTTTKGGAQTVTIAQTYIGMNAYKYGSWDCSKFTQTVAAKSGVNIPRTASTQFDWFKQKGMLVNMKNAKAGDIVYLSSSASPSGWHTGIYLGNGQMIDNSGRGRPIKVNSLTGRQIKGFGQMSLLAATPKTVSKSNNRQIPR